MNTQGTGDESGGEADLGGRAALTFWLLPQVNTPAAEVLYTVIQDWAQLDTGSTVLDVCCGTGTIGLALARVSLLPSREHTPPTPPYVITCSVTP